MRSKSRAGFTLIELMVVVAIVAFLAVLAIPSFMRFIAKTKRTEAYINLNSIYTSQKIYHAEHGRYTNVMFGKDGLGWKPEGYKGGGAKEHFNYTYGLPGQEGVNFFTGRMEASADSLQKAYADKDKFLVIAAADIDGDGKLDILSVNEANEIEIVSDDLN
ncbi:prepilin-type N-terminal cleavage/methylation domain-containing protein [bacterium]|jgi:prepilin-type N-terminal cleavage/methylation domain-containing protein|nr:prepilin-type N-terminal cleavage/methylation domain-containing protein [bacterium]MBT3903931.1 prepilin-type N-terminal cleavage/methylation domain-containing protein [bacterium]MBT4578126.1 prepilin-type N-terminal cleavage/methylation domain-containing protein [bacterium]MBT5345538.1 prepilin-type N-terminal cleavage/methylation domain-containing protein [bacterium]MBT6131329.1 prepilin-type N-terminal cleavage/methylation domain-containing protein [bacterium]